MKKINYIDLFAGCGGLSDGFEKTGKFNLVAAVEWEMAPFNTLARRLTNKWKYANVDETVIRFDMQRTTELLNGYEDDPEYGTSIGLKRIASKAGQIEIIIGGPPCQAYSIAGRVRDAHGMKYDYRNYLFESYLKVVNEFKPKIFIFENVPGILSASPGGVPIIKRIRSAFSHIGYDIAGNIEKIAVSELSEYAVPQNRKRVIILGVKRRHFGAGSETAIKAFYDKILPAYKTSEKLTVFNAIGNLKPFYPTPKPYKSGKKLFSHKPQVDTLPGHIPRFHSVRDIRIFRELAEDVLQGAGKYQNIDDLKKLYTQRTGNKSSVHKYYVLRWNKQSNTIPAHLHKDGLRHIHPDPKQARSITVREAARLQTFDDDYDFIGSQGDQYKMIGNAVPPRFAHALARAAYDLLQKKID